ncbi:MAG: hypothetical protein AAGK04_00635 [Planctomycetota bacterium]
MRLISALIASAAVSTSSLAEVAETGFVFDLVQITLETRTSEFGFVDRLELYNSQPHTLGGETTLSSTDTRVEDIRVTSAVENVGNTRTVSYVIETISGDGFATPDVFDDLVADDTGLINFAIRNNSGAVRDDEFLASGTRTARLFGDDDSLLVQSIAASTDVFSIGFGSGLNNGRNPLDPADFGAAPARFEYSVSYTVVPAPACAVALCGMGTLALRRRS